MATKKSTAMRQLAQNRLGFKKWLVMQQLEEAGFLYEQRRFLLDGDQLAWLDFEDKETRYLNHLHALTLLNTKRDVDIQSIVTEPGELHTVLSLFCREGRFDDLAAMVDTAVLSDTRVFDAVADALKWEAPVSWQRRLLQLIGCHDRMVDVLAEVYGYRRWPVDALLHHAALLSEKLIWAIGRTGSKGGLIQLNRLLADEKTHPLNTQASIALLRWNDSAHLKRASDKVHPTHFSILPIGLLGDTRVQPRLASLAATTPNADLLIALGLLGKPDVVPLLIEQLSHEMYGEQAATALQLITGADLFESVFIPDAICEEELTETELERHIKGEPVFEEGCIPGTTVDRLTQDQKTWSHWWQHHRAHFNPDIPYRLGSPYSPLTLVAQLASPHSTMLIRSLAYEELVIRYRLDFAFEIDFLVSDQKQILVSLQNWLKAHHEVSKRYPGAVSF